MAKKILVFGDSIAWGAFDTEKGGWVERLKIHFLNNYGQKGIGVYNLAVSGANTDHIRRHLRADVNKITDIESEDMIVVFSIGSNDPAYINTREKVFVRPDKFKENITSLITLSKKLAKRTVFTGLMKVDEKMTKPWDEDLYWENSDIEEYNQIIIDQCRQNKIGFIPLIDLITVDDLADGLHPNSEGHRKIFERVKVELENIV